MASPGVALALPFVTTLEDCGDFSKTVLPFIYQLEELPWKIAKAGFDFSTLKKVYLETNPLITAFAFSLFLAVVFLLVSEVNKNYSQVDRVWSILPTVYIAHYSAWAHLSGLYTRRLDNVLAFAVVWSVWQTRSSVHPRG